MLKHSLDLVEESAVFERRNQIAHRFTLDTDVRGEDVVAYCKHAGDYDHRAPVE